MKIGASEVNGLLNRRNVLTGGAALAAAATISSNVSLAGNAMTYDEAAASTWVPMRADGGLRELVRYATLAANSHNTQPWSFKIEKNRISILPDFSRRCSAVDPDDHHLFASLGCAAENLVHAAAALGYKATCSLGADAAATIEVALEPSEPRRSDLFEAIPRRR